MRLTFLQSQEAWLSSLHNTLPISADVFLVFAINHCKIFDLLKIFSREDNSDDYTTVIRELTLHTTKVY